MPPKTSISMLHAMRSRPVGPAASACLLLLQSAAQPADTSPAQQFERFSAQAATCASCHGNPPTKPGRHASTGKAIGPMAPAANPTAFTDSAKIDKWFRRNCKDVLQRWREGRRACHTAADRGFFDDDNLKVPAGTDARMRRSFND